MDYRPTRLVVSEPCPPLLDGGGDQVLPVIAAKMAATMDLDAELLSNANVSNRRIWGTYHIPIRLPASSFGPRSWF